MNNKTNVLFILSDQHNAKVLGHKNHPDVNTPNLDKMAANGIRFDNAITQNPICTPSRMSWISGQYCHNHGYYGLSGHNPDGLPTVFGHFRKNGYYTGAMGKIHCPEYWVEDDVDVFLETCDASIGGNPEYMDYLKKKGIEDCEDHIAMRELGDRGRQTCEGRMSKSSYEDSMEGWAVRRAIDTMEEAKAKDMPFFVHVSLPKPHQCYTPSQPFWDMYKEDELTLPTNCFYDMKVAKKAPHLIRQSDVWKTGNWTIFEPQTFEAGRLRKLHGYLGNVSQVDYAVGELLDWLDEQNLSEDTIIIYSSDHGDYACEHNIMEKAPGICSDAITRIPYIWQWKNHLPEGAVNNELVETVDFAATVCSLCKIEPMETVDGKDISRLLYDEGSAVREIAVTEFAWSKSVRMGDYRLVYYPPQMFIEDYPQGFGELYNIKDDPWEMKNLYFDDEYKELVKQIERLLLDWIITTTRPATVLHIKPEAGDQRIIRYGRDINADGKINPERIKKVKNGNYI